MILSLHGTSKVYTVSILTNVLWFTYDSPCCPGWLVCLAISGYSPIACQRYAAHRKVSYWLQLFDNIHKLHYCILHDILCILTQWFGLCFSTTAASLHGVLDLHVKDFSSPQPFPPFLGDIHIFSLGLLLHLLRLAPLLKSLGAGVHFLLDFAPHRHTIFLPWLPPWGHKSSFFKQINK